MKYISTAILILIGLKAYGAEPTPMKEYRMEVLRHPSAPLPIPIQSSMTNNLSAEGRLPPRQLKRATFTPRATIIQPSPYTNSQHPQIQRAHLNLAATPPTQRMQAQQIRSGVIRRRPDPEPSLSLLMAVTAFNEFFKDTGYQDNHYVNSVRYRYESQYKEWVYEFYVIPTIRQEAESTKPGYQEFITTSYQVNMRGEVFVIDTPSWREIRNN